MSDTNWRGMGFGRNVFLILSMVLITAILFFILVGAYRDVIKINEASLLISSILALATFGYVLLTFNMAGTMREEMEHSKEIFKLRRKDDIVSIIEDEIQPIYDEIQSHRSSFDASGPEAYDVCQINETMYQRLPELETQFRSPSQAASLSNDVTVNAGDVYSYFSTLNQYKQKYDEAVTNLSLLISENSGEIDVEPSKSDSYAKTALALEPTGRISRRLWRESKNEIVPLRNEVSETTDELLQLRNEITEEGHELMNNLGIAKSNLKQEYYITESDL